MSNFSPLKYNQISKLFMSSDSLPTPCTPFAIWQKICLSDKLNYVSSAVWHLIHFNNYWYEFFIIQESWIFDNRSYGRDVNNQKQQACASQNKNPLKLSVSIVHGFLLILVLRFFVKHSSVKHVILKAFAKNKNLTILVTNHVKNY